LPQGAWELPAQLVVTPRVNRAIPVVLLLSGVFLGALEAGGAELESPHCGRVKAQAAAQLPDQTMVSAGNGLPPEVIQRVMRQNFGRFRVCYEHGLRSCPNLTGSVSVRFTIQPTGAVTGARDHGSDVPDSAVIACVVRQVGELTFPSFKGKPIKVSYPIAFSPGG